VLGAANRRATNILAITGVKKKTIPASPWSKNMVVIVEVANAMSTTKNAAVIWQKRNAEANHATNGLQKWISLANNLKRTWGAVAPVVRAKRCKNVTKRQQKCVPMPLKNPAKREENQLVGLVSKGTNSSKASVFRALANAVHRGTRAMVTATM